MIDERDEQAIDILANCIDDYVIGEYCTGEHCIDKNMCKDKDCPFHAAIETVLNLIQTQQEEIEKKDKIIDEAIEWIKSLHDSLIEEYGTYETEFSINGDYIEENKIKEYFINKVEKENKDE